MRTLPRSLAGGSWMLGLATLLASTALCVHNHHPDLPRPLSLILILEPPVDESSQPLVVTGRIGVANFLHIRYQDSGSVVFGYDSWGTPGISSAPVPVVPGTPVPLQVEMPGLGNTEGSTSQRLRVVYGGKVVLDQDVAFHPRSRAALFFAENPNQGSCAGPDLHGRLLRHDGRHLLGSVSGYFSPGERLHAWLKLARWQLVTVLLLSACAAVWGRRLRWPALDPRATMEAWRRHGVFLVSAVVCTLVFVLVLIHGRPDITHPFYLSAFYDFQAASLLDGRLDVPYEAVRGEAFLLQGKAFGYFGIVPALLRLPFVVLDVGFGMLTEAFMTVEYFGCLFFAYLILGVAWSMRDGEGSRPRPWAVILLVANLGLGSTLFFVSSRAFVYHEALTSGLCFALATTYFSLRALAAPEERWWIGALVCGTLSVHCRPPLGLFALCLVGVTAVAIIVRPLFSAGAGPWPSRLPRRWPRYLTVGALALLGILSFNGLSYLKFRTFDGAPLRYHEQYDAARLARFEGKSFHLNNMPLNASAYLLRPGWDLRAHFPYLTTSAHQPGPGSKAKMDLAEPMLGLPFAMPGLFGLALAGLLGSFWWRRKLRPVGLVLSMAVLPMTLALFAAVATSQRYTADFLPFLVCAAALGTALLDAARPSLRTLARSLAVLATVASILITLALTLRYQGELVWNIPDNVSDDYQKMGNAVDGLLGIEPKPVPPTTP